jgi:glycosyltransferase involved in cell wall biosynthesis
MPGFGQGGRLTDSYRVLMVAPTSFFLDYGCHVRILEEARALQALGHRVTLVTYYLGRDLPGLEIVRTRPTPWRANYEVGSSRHKLVFDVFLAWTGVRTILRRRFDIIHGHLYDGALIGRLLSLLGRAPLVFDFQGSLASEMIDHHFLDRDGRWYPWVRLLQARIEELPEAIVTSTERGAQLLRQRLRRSDHIVSLPDCVNLDVFRPGLLSASEVAERKAELGIPTDRPLIVYLGLLADYQGTPLLVRAAQLLRKSGANVHFLIMGFPGVDAHRKLAESLGADDLITFTGKVPYEAAPTHLALGDIAVAPKLSDTEGAGKILNYMAMGLPTVAFDTPISREYLGGLGTYAGMSGSPHTLAEAIASLLENPDRGRQLGLALRERAMRRFSQDQFGEQLSAVYRDLVDRRSGADKSGTPT